MELKNERVRTNSMNNRRQNHCPIFCVILEEELIRNSNIRLKTKSDLGTY